MRQTSQTGKMELVQSDLHWIVLGFELTVWLSALTNGLDQLECQDVLKESDGMM